jgi:hypothetical protein
MARPSTTAQVSGDTGVVVADGVDRQPASTAMPAPASTMTGRRRESKA